MKKNKLKIFATIIIVIICGYTITRTYLIIRSSIIDAVPAAIVEISKVDINNQEFLKIQGKNCDFFGEANRLIQADRELNQYFRDYQNNNPINLRFMDKLIGNGRLALYPIKENEPFKIFCVTSNGYFSPYLIGGKYELEIKYQNEQIIQKVIKNDFDSYINIFDF